MVFHIHTFEYFVWLLFCEIAEPQFQSPFQRSDKNSFKIAKQQFQTHIFISDFSFTKNTQTVIPDSHHRQKET